MCTLSCVYQSFPAYGFWIIFKHPPSYYYFKYLNPWGITIGQIDLFDLLPLILAWQFVVVANLGIGIWFSGLLAGNGWMVMVGCLYEIDEFLALHNLVNFDVD